MKEVQLPAVRGGSSSLRALLWPPGFWADRWEGRVPQSAFSSPFLLPAQRTLSVSAPSPPHPGTAGDSGGQSHGWFAFHPQRLLRRLRTPTLTTALKPRSRFLVPAQPQDKYPPFPHCSFCSETFFLLPIQGKIPVLCGPCKLHLCAEFGVFRGILLLACIQAWA